MATWCARARLTGWCGLCYSGIKGRGCFPGHAGPHHGRPKRRRTWIMLQRRERQGPGGGSSKPLLACAWSKKHPTVAEFLSSSVWPDGEPRVLGTITFLFDQGMCKAALNDRDADVSSFVSAKTFTELMEALDKGLSGYSLEWR